MRISPALSLMAGLALLPAAVGGQEREAAAGAAPAPRAAADQLPSGPLRVGERNPLYRLFLTPLVQGADLLGEGEMAAEVSASYSNIFELGSSSVYAILFDLERLTSGVTVRYGVTRRVELGVRVATQTNWSGFLDPFIQTLHRTFGLPNADREKFPDDVYEVYVTDPSRALHIVSIPPGTQLEDPRVQAAFLLAGGAGRDGALTLRASAKIPVGSAAVGTGRADGAVELAARRSWGRTHLHLSAGGVFLGVPARLAGFIRPAALVASVSVERQVASRVSLLAQLVGGTGYAHNFGAVELDGYPLNLVLGAAGQMGSSWGWQASFAEDAQPEGPSVDFTLDLQLSRRW